MHVVITFASRLFIDNVCKLGRKILSLSGYLLSSPFVSSSQKFRTQRIIHFSVSVSHTPLISFQAFNSRSGRKNPLGESTVEIGDMCGFDASSQVPLHPSALIVQLHMGCHYPTIYLPNYLCVQTEQLFSYVLQPDSAHQSSFVHRVMTNALVVLSMSDSHTSLLHQQGYPHVFTVPFFSSTVPAAKSYVQKNLIQNVSFDSFSSPRAHETVSMIDKIGAGVCNAHHDSRSCHLNSTSVHGCVCDAPTFDDIQLPNPNVTDIFFYGACSPRRLEFISLLQAYSTNFSLYSTNSTLNNSGLSIDTICAANWGSALFDEFLHTRVKAARVITNLLSFPLSSLPVHRLMYLLSMKKCVVSERSLTDPLLDEKYSSGTILSSSFEEMVDFVDELLHDNAKRLACEEWGRKTYFAIERNIGYLAEALRTAIWKIEKKMKSVE